jgi:hypothetical protein
MSEGLVMSTTCTLKAMEGKTDEMLDLPGVAENTGSFSILHAV